MALRYWVGGSATWDSTAGTKWSATSGGTGGASAPTSADDVFFDANSGAVTVTLGTGFSQNIRSINFTGFTGTFTGSGSINASTSITLSPTVNWTASGTLGVVTGTCTFTSNGFTGASNLNLRIDSGGVLSMQDALSCFSINLVQGTLTTNNFNLTASTITSSSSSTRVINFGSSIVTLSGSTPFNNSSTTGLTVNPGTSTLVLTSGSTTLTLPAVYNVSYENPNGIIANINAPLTFNNLSVQGPNNDVTVSQVIFNSNQIINGTLSTSSLGGNRRIWFRSDIYGVRRTLTVNGPTSITDVDFRDIIVTGTSSPISGTRIGNRGACTGINFSTPKTVYWNSLGTRNWMADNWAATSGGSTNPNSFPLPQDTAIFDNASAAGFTVNMGSSDVALPNIDASTRTLAMTFGLNTLSTVYGSWINGSGVSFSGTSTITFSGESAKTINSAGKTFPCGITINAYGGTVQLGAALNIGTLNFFVITNGTFNSANYNITAAGFSSNNTNPRTINLGTSTVTLNSTTGNSDQNIDLNPVGLSGSLASATFNVANLNSRTRVGSNGVLLGTVNLNPGQYFNVINAPLLVNTLNISCSGGFNGILLNADVTVNTALNVTNSAANQRAFLARNIFSDGTRSILTINGTASVNNCDFRDIEVRGSAAPLSGTSMGDAGNNVGITFTAPKTVYWNLSGSQNWQANGWAATSGGTPNASNYPLPQDTSIFDNTGAAGTVLFNSGVYVYPNIDATARTSAMTFLFASSAAVGFNSYQFCGDFKAGSGVTVSNVANVTVNMCGANRTQTILSNGKVFNASINFAAINSTFVLADAFSNYAITLSYGTLDAGTSNVTTGSFNSNNSNVRTLKMGSGVWTLSGTGTVWDAGTVTNFALVSGTSEILLSDTSTTARTFAGGGLYYNKLTIGGTTGTSTTTISGNNTFGELASTKTVAHTIALGTTTQFFGKWTVTGSAGNVVTLTGTGTSHRLYGAATSGIDYLAMGSIGFNSSSAFNTAEFYAGANSTGTAGAPVFRTAAPAPRTLYWVGGTGNWSSTARWSLSSGGTGGEPAPRSTDNVIFDNASGGASYTATVDVVSRVNQLTIAGPASGTLTFAGANGLAIQGNTSIASSGVNLTFNGGFIFSGSTTGKTFTTNGVSLGSNNVWFVGIGSEWTLGSALSCATFNLLSGTVNTNNYNLTAASIASDYGISRAINLGSSVITLSDPTGIGFGTSTNSSQNLTLNAGTSQINLTNGTPTFSGNTKTFYDVFFTSTGISTATIQGNNTFNNLTIAGTTSSISTISINANQTVNGTLTISAGTNATRRTFVRSDTIGTTRTLTCNAVASLTDIDFRDITIAGTAAPVSGTRLGDCGGNSGITFPAPKTVYRVGNQTSWIDTTSWAASSGGTANVNNYPLPQDTAIFDNAATITLPLALSGFLVNLPTIDASARTNALTINHAAIALTSYGGFILGSGVTTTGTTGLTFSGRGTNTITCAGKTITFSITIDAPSGTVQLGDAFSSSNTISLVRGTFNAVTYNYTATNFEANNSNIRAVNMGSGLWTITGTGNCWQIPVATNMTFTKGTADILLSNNTTAGKTFNGGNLSYNKLTFGGGTSIATYTIGNSNTFTEIASTKAVAHTIDFGTTTQLVGAFTVTGTAGNVVTITGNTSNLIYTGAGSITNSDYLNLQGRAFGPNGEITGIWQTTTNSVNNGTFGWQFVTPVAASNANFFLLFA